MKTIHAANVAEAVHEGLSHLLDEGIVEGSRNGSVIVAPEPVCTIYNDPKKHVLLGATRNANPFFHLMEALWMLAGRHDLKFPLQFNKRFSEYSDDGLNIWGAYGFRWRRFFDFDQLREIIDMLRKDPKSRRAVLSMWSPVGDLIVSQSGEGGPTGKDVPCNTHAYFDMRFGRLNMTVCNRSNDAIWGAYGANVVHFSLLLEYMAEQIGVPMGTYRQVSNNFHAYTDVYDVDKLEEICGESYDEAMYTDRDGVPLDTVPLGSNYIGFMDDLREFLVDGHITSGREGFLTDVAQPMYEAWFAWKQGDIDRALRCINAMRSCDWSLACYEWINRRKAEKEKKNVA